jgi:hypothetical protein
MSPQYKYEAPTRSLPDKIIIGLLAAGLLINTSVGLANTMSRKNKSDIQPLDENIPSAQENACTSQNWLFTDFKGMFVLSTEAGKIAARCVTQPEPLK